MSALAQSLIPRIRDRIKRSQTATLMAYGLDGMVASCIPSFGAISSRSGLVHESISLEASIQYIERVYGEYMKLLGPDALKGRIAEIGPGDSCGVALKLRAGGAEQIDLVDRFNTQRDPVVQKTIYEALRERDLSLKILLEGIDLSEEENLPGIRRWVGEAAAAERYFKHHGPYDAIVSCAVLEHLYDPIRALKDMMQALKPGGRMCHKVDLRDHGLLSDHHDELTWLETSEWWHRWMTRSRGRPNRVLYPHYRQILSSLGSGGEIWITALAGVGDLDPYMPLGQIPSHLLEKAASHVMKKRTRLAASLKCYSDEELSVTGLFLVLEK